MILGEDFKFRDDIKEETVPIELMLDKYKGVVYRYKQVKVLENKNETATVKFDYDLLEKGDYTDTKLRKDKKFEEALGLILNTLILEVVDEDRKNDSKKSDQE